jgi:predicted amidophosphoribosyltransferase
MRFGQWAGEAFLEFFWPQRCLLCQGEGGASLSFFPRGKPVKGLRSWDFPHLCVACWAQLAGRPCLRRLKIEGHGSLLVAAGTQTTSALVSALGTFKYGGVRGLTWPLGLLAVRGFPLGWAAGGPVEALTAVPLHWRRRRTRGFNQSELLGRFLARGTGLCFARPVRRCRATRQQAKIPSTDKARLRNVEGAFVARPPENGGPCRIAIVDDLVTSGATLLSAAAALRRAGWKVGWALTVGLTPGADPGESDLDSSRGDS